MKKRLFFFLTAAFLAVTHHAHALDASNCNADATIEYHRNGSVKSCQLKDNFDINGITCNGLNYISLYANGNLESCVLSVSATVGEKECESLGPISFFPDGKIKSCTKANY
jgi:hypothetical protein